MMSQPPRVFISYSHDSEAHRDFVLALANRLREEYVESWIDQYVPGFPPQGWQRWMEDEIEQADFVLVICTPLYLQRFTGKDREGGRGVNREGLIISQLLYDDHNHNTKFIPVLPQDGKAEHVPTILRSHFYQLDADYQDLYRLLTGQPSVIPPPLGKPVQLPAKTVTTASPSLSLETAYLQSLLQQSQLLFADKTYTTLSGKFQQDRQLIPSECMMSASFLFEVFAPNSELRERECHRVPEKHDDLLAAFDQHKRLVLLGEPGTGKTFSLWRIAAEQARKTLAELAGLLPVIIPLNRWTDENQSLQEFVLKQMGALAGQFDALRKAGRLLPLLDALNEIPFDQRAGKLPQVRAFVSQPEFKHLLLTCRKRDYVGKLEQDMHRLTIEPLDPPRVYQFLRNYFHYFEQQQPGSFEPGIADKLFWRLAGGTSIQQCWGNWQQHGKSSYWLDFWELKSIPENWPQELQRWNDSPRWNCLNDLRSLLKLAANPYLLFLITTLYARYRELPKSRIDLFGRFVEVLLRREEEEKAKSRDYIPKRGEMLAELKQLAWQLQSRSGALQEARTVLSREEAAKTMPEKRLEFAAAASLLELTRDAVRFSHQLLQEFFTAQRFSEERDAGLQASQIWPAASWWEPQGWEEAARLAAEYEADPKPFLQWLAAGNPKLAAEIARDRKQLHDALAGFREPWQAAITDTRQYPNPHERHAISTALAWLDWDKRPGIGLDANGLPDIDWVEIDGYKMGRYPVTNRQFQAFIADGGYETDEWWKDLQKADSLPNHRWTEANRPVEGVSWYDAMAFCRWASDRMGLDIRLPTEQQWEKAARYPDDREYPWGNEFTSQLCNAKNELQETSAVGIYPSGQSHLGLMDMAGNVWEWCLNKYDKPEMVEPDVSGDDRAIRGGSWYYASDLVRCAIRFGLHPDARLNTLGFRVVLGV